MKISKDYLSVIQEYESIIASCIVIMVLLALSALLLLPNLEKARIIYTQKQTLNSKLDKLRAKDTSLSAIDADYFRDIFAKMNYILPDNKDYVSLFSTFDALEQKTGVTILRTDVQLGVLSTNSASLQKAPGLSAYMIPLTMEVIGDITSLTTLFSILTDLSGRILTLDTVQLASRGRDVYQATLTGRAYYYPLPPTLADIESPLVQIPESADKYLETIALLNITEETESDKEIEVGKKNLFR